MTKMSRKQCHKYILRTFLCEDYKDDLLYRQIYSKFPTLSHVLSIFGGHWHQANGKVEVVTSNGVMEAQLP